MSVQKMARTAIFRNSFQLPPPASMWLRRLWRFIVLNIVEQWWFSSTLTSLYRRARSEELLIS